MASNAVLGSCQSWKSGADTCPCPPLFRHKVESVTMRSGSRYASGLSSTALTTLNTAVLAPMPSAMTTTASRVKPGFLRRDRRANLRSILTAGAGPTAIREFTEAMALAVSACGTRLTHCGAAPCAALRRPRGHIHTDNLKGYGSKINHKPGADRSRGPTAPGGHSAGDDRNS